MALQLGGSPVSSGDGVRTITAAAIAELVGGRLIGDPDATVCRVAPLDRAGAADATFLASPRYAAALASCAAGVVLVDESLAATPGGERARVLVCRPHEAMLAVVAALYPAECAVPAVASSARIAPGVRLGSAVRVDDYAVVGAGADIGDGAWVGSHSVIGAGVTVGAGARIHAAATLYPGTVLGERSIVHAGVRLGSDGFGYVSGSAGHARIQHVGRCVIGADVEIGANTTIDRGSIDDTVIGAGTKIDNLVHIAHNVHVGSRCLIMAQVGIAGSSRVGDGAVLAGQAGITGHVTIGAGARIAAQAGVFGDVPAGESWSGYPARPHRESLRASAALLKLPALMRRIEKLFGASERA